MGGSSKSQTVGYKYYVGMHMVLCRGPVDFLIKGVVSDKTAFSGKYTSGTYSISKNDLFGGESREGGVSGTFDVMGGESSQGVNSYLSSKLGSFVPAFRGVLSVVFRQMYLGINPYLKKWAFRAQRVHVRQNGLVQWYDSKSAIPAGSFQKLSVVFVLDGSGSMLEVVSGTGGKTRWQLQYEQISKALDFFISFNVSAVVGICIFGDASKTSGDYTYRTVNSQSDIDSLKSFVATWPIIIPYGTYWDYGMQGAKEIFGANSEGTPIVIFTTDGQPNTGHLQPAIAIRNSVPGLKVHGILIDGVSTSELNQLDNTGGAVSASSTGDEVLQACLEALETVSFFDMNPAHIIRECLTDPDWGMGYAEADMDATSFTYAADVLFSEQFGMSLLWDTQITIEEFVQLVCKHINASIYVDRSTGKFVLKLIRQDYNENSLLELNTSNVSQVQDFSRVQFGELTNSVTVSYWNTTTGNDSTITVQDIALAAMQGATIATSVKYEGITNQNIASRIAQRDLKALSTPLISCTIYANTDAASLNIGDVFKLTWPDYDLEQVVMRVVTIGYGDGRSNRVRLTCTQDVFAMPDTAYVAPTPPEGVPTTEGPLAVAKRVAFELPYLEAVQQVGQSSIDSNLATNPDIAYFAIAAARPSSNSLNARLYTDAGGGYQEQSNVDFCPFAELAENIGKTTTVFQIQNLNDAEEIQLNTWFQIDAEIMQIVSIVGTTATVKRGLLDTVPVSHSSGATLFFWDLYAGQDATQYVSGEIVSGKLSTVTGSGVLAVSSAPSDSVTMVGRMSKPYPPGNFKINTVPFAEIIGGLDALSLSWSHRDRTQQTGGTLYDQTTGDIGPEVGTTYNVRVYGEANTLGRSTNGITGTSFAYNATDEQNDFSLPYDLEGDAYFANVASLLHFDGTDGSTVITDVVSGVTWSASGNAQLDTAWSKFGPSSLFCDGSGDYITSSNMPNLNAATYTVECWIRFRSGTRAQASQTVLTKWSGSGTDDSYLMLFAAANTTSPPNAMRFDWRTGSVTYVTNSMPFAFAFDTDYFVEINRSSNTLRFFVNGVLIGTLPCSNSHNQNSSPTCVGTTLSCELGSILNLNGWVDDLRVTNGIARNTANYSPPNSAFPNSMSSSYRLNGKLRVELESSRDGRLSYQKYSHEILREGYGFNYGLLYGGKA